MKITIKKPLALYEKGRKNINEDILYPAIDTATLQNRLFIICDGDGGTNKGDIAAQLVRDYFVEYFTKFNPPKAKQIGQLYINEALRFTERRLQKYLETHPESTGMRSSMALLYFNEDNTITLAWVGNCRIYHVNGTQLLYRTDDHMESAWINNKPQIISRTISATESVWASNVNIADIQPNDYFLMVTQGVTEVLEDRNIKYLLSQGNTSKNEDILSKIKEVCTQGSTQNFSAYLIQIEQAPTNETLANKRLLQQRRTTTTTTNNDLQAPTLPSAKKIAARQQQQLDLNTPAPIPALSKNTFKKPTITASSGKAIAIVSFIFLLTAAALAYKYFGARPEDLFKNYAEQGKSYLQEQKYPEAIEQFQQALQVKLHDTTELPQVRTLLTQATEQYTLIQANQLLQANNYVKARTLFEQAYAINPQNTQIQQNILYISQKINAQKDSLLVVANTQLSKKRYEKAKAMLYEALYLDQKDLKTLYLINLCNMYLDQDTTTLDQAIKTAIALKENNATLNTDNTLADNIFNEHNPDSIKNQNRQTLSTEEQQLLYGNATPTTSYPATAPPGSTPVMDVAQREFDRAVADGNRSFNDGDFVTAKILYQKALSFKYDKTVQEKLQQCSTSSSDQSYNNLMQTAEKEYKDGNLNSAISYYQQALQYKPNDPRATEKINAIKNNEQQYQLNYSKATDAFNNGDYAAARNFFEQALQYTTDKSAIKTKIDECNLKLQK